MMLEVTQKVLRENGFRGLYARISAVCVTGLAKRGVGVLLLREFQISRRG